MNENLLLTFCPEEDRFWRTDSDRMPYCCIAYTIGLLQTIRWRTVWMRGDCRITQRSGNREILVDIAEISYVMLINEIIYTLFKVYPTKGYKNFWLTFLFSPFCEKGRFLQHRLPPYKVIFNRWLFKLDSESQLEVEHPTKKSTLR